MQELELMSCVATCLIMEEKERDAKSEQTDKEAIEVSLNRTFYHLCLLCLLLKFLLRHLGPVKLSKNSFL